MDVGNDLTLQWVEEVGNVIHEEVICDLEEGLETQVEEVISHQQQETVEEIEEVVEETVVQDDQEILMVPQTSDMESIYIVPQDQGHDYLNIQVAEEVITDTWDKGEPDDGVEVPETKVSHDNLLEYDDMEIPLPIDQDSYTNTRPYPCDFCSRRFRKKANLMNHMVAHQTDRPHGCNLCGARYVRKCDLNNHLKIHAYAPSRDGLEDDYNDADPLAHDVDDYSKVKRKKLQSSMPRKRKINPGQGRKHSTTHEDMSMINTKWPDLLPNNDQQVPRWPVTDASKPWVCQFCGVGFAREKALGSHARIHGGDSPFECTSCTEMFWDINSLQEHMRLKHGIGLMSATSDDQDDIMDHDATTYEPAEPMGEYFCDTCGVTFHRLDLLKRHRRIHVVKQEMMENNDGANQHHVCNVCGEWFTEALALLAHAELHASRSPSRRCLLCGERCRDDAEVAEHVREMHGEDAPPNTCILCGKTCKDKKSLLKHSWIHNNDKTFACTKCGKRFHSKARLRRHMMSHRNKMVACDECGEEFPDGRALVSHRHSHNKDLGGRTFPCRECGKTFGSRSSQQIHIRIHTGERPYQCRFCWKAFADGGTLRKHERIHTGEKPYGCAICPRAFNQRVVLREHVRAHHSGPDPKCHNSLTPYLCKVCGEAYPSSEEIVAHIVAHCDENTAMRRQPQTGPRKYKRRRKLKTEEPMLTENFDFMDGLSDHNDDVGMNVNNMNGSPMKQRKLSIKKRVNVEESYQSVLKSFESSLQNISSIVNSNSKSSSLKKASKKKMGKKEPKTTLSVMDHYTDLPTTSTNSQGRPKMIHTQKTRVPVQLGTEGAKRGQKTRTLVTKTAKSLMGSVESNERNRPRTKNVSCHIEGRQQFAAATFPKDFMTRDIEMINVKVEPELQYPANNGIAPKRKSPQKRKKSLSPSKRRSRLPLMEPLMDPLPGGNSDIQPTRLFESVMDGSNLEVAFESNNGVTTTDMGHQESILPDFSKSMHVSEVNKINVKIEPSHEDMMSDDLMGTVEEEVPETIIPDAVEYTCEMCMAVFGSRAELLLHVPIHI